MHATLVYIMGNGKVIAVRPRLTSRCAEKTALGADGACGLR